MNESIVGFILAQGRRDERERERERERENEDKKKLLLVMFK